MPVMAATAAGTQDESAPEDDGDDENDASQGDDHGRKPKWPATSVPPVRPVWRFGGCTRLLSCSCRLSRMFRFSHRSEHAPQSQECAVRMRRRDLRRVNPLPPLRTSTTKVNSCPCPRPRCCAVGLKPSLDPSPVAGANRPPPQAPVPLQTTYRNSFVKRVPEL